MARRRESLPFKVSCFSNFFHLTPSSHTYLSPCISETTKLWPRRHKRTKEDNSLFWMKKCRLSGIFFTIENWKQNAKVNILAKQCKAMLPVCAHRYSLHLQCEILRIERRRYDTQKCQVHILNYWQIINIKKMVHSSTQYWTHWDGSCYTATP